MIINPLTYITLCDAFIGNMIIYLNVIATDSVKYTAEEIP
jgi:hypothetical protein